MSDYAAFLERKTHLGGQHGFAPYWIPDYLFPFQQALTSWALEKGRGALFEDCGLGKTVQQLVWAENVVRHTGGKRVLILTPLAVGQQTVAEGEKFGIACEQSREGTLPTSPIVVSNYEQLHRFHANDFIGMVCDESSILKHFSGSTQKAVTRFIAKLPYRLLCTATAAPNDYIELGTSSEALGELGYSDMLSRFFQQQDQKAFRMNDVKLAREANHNHFAKLAYRIAQQIGQWRMKAHAETPFWRWVASWARACRMPSDLGFADDGFRLPPLTERTHIIEPSRPAEGMLFTIPAYGLQEEREERRRTLEERCRFAASLVQHAQPAVVWCHLNDESRRLRQLIPDAVEVKGTDSDAAKQDAFQAFGEGRVRVLITKPVIGAWGLNWQHCAHVVTFVSHSYEQYYQAIRRCYRFGQRSPVTVDIIATTGEARVSENMARKAHAAALMFTQLVRYMHMGEHVSAPAKTTDIIEVPAWIRHAS